MLFVGRNLWENDAVSILNAIVKMKIPSLLSARNGSDSRMAQKAIKKE